MASRKLFLCWWGSLMFVVGAGIFADSVEPEEPGIVLPPVFLEIEDLSEETIEAVLPEFDPEILPEPTLLLPEAGELALSDDIFDIDAPDQPGRSLFDGTAPGAASLFSEGTIGLGTQNTLIGDLSLYKLGPEPRFTMRFFHDSVDGYGPRLAGTTFFSTEDTLDGSFELNRDPVSLGFGAQLREREVGLQDIGSYYSLSHRFLSGDMSASYAPREQIALGIDVGVSSATQVLSSDTPRILSEFRVAPQFSLEAALGIVTLSLNTAYSLTISEVLTSSLHTTDARAGILLELPVGLDIGLQGGASWDTSDGFLFPVAATLDGTLGRILGFRIEGGYRHQRASLHDLWESYPLLETPDLSAEFGWFASADLQWSLWNSVVLGTGLEYSIMNQATLRSDTPDPTTGLFLSSTVSNQTFVSPVVTVTWRPTETFDLTGEWSAQITQSAGFTPDLLIAVEGSYESTSGSFGASGGFAIESYGDIPTPDVFMSGFYRIAEGVTLNLEARDMLAFISADERTTWGPYISPGFRVILSTRISL